MKMCNKWHIAIRYGVEYIIKNVRYHFDTLKLSDNLYESDFFLDAALLRDKLFTNLNQSQKLWYVRFVAACVCVFVFME